MLSSIGRSAIRRVVAGASQPSTTRVFQSVWHLQAAGVSKSTDNALSHTQVSFEFRRFLATATKAPRASKTSAESKPKTSVKKAKDKAAAKPKTKGRPKKKKVVTPEEKAKREIQKLKALVLSPPKLKPTSAWKVLFSELSVPGQAVSVYAKNVAEKYKSLSPGELEAYNHTANQNKEANEVAFKQWIQSHTPEQIRVANNARMLLKKRTGKSYPLIPDDRIPKKARTEHALFTQDRWASGDLKGIKFSEASRILRDEYLALPESERKVYKDRAEADKERYIHEFRAAFHRDPPYLHKQATA